MDWDHQFKISSKKGRHSRFLEKEHEIGKFPLLSVIDETSYRLDRQKIKVEVEKILELALTKYQKSKNDLGEINLLFTTPKNIRKLNKKFLQKDQPTDVLTFPSNIENEVSGDIAICLEEVYRNELPLNKGGAFLFYETILHGFLHLLGLEHDYSRESLERVYQLQDEILKKIRLNHHLIHEFHKKTNQ